MYQLYYWPGIPGRGEFVRLVLEAAGVAYRDVGREEGFEAVLESVGLRDISYPNMPFAPPYVKVDELIVFQTANICDFVAGRHGLTPTDKQGRRFALGVAMTIEDFAREIHDTHHPIAVGLYYEEQKTESLRRAEDFRDNRLPTFLRYFENIIRGNRSNTGWLIGDALTYPDLSLFQVIEGLRYAFPNTMAQAEHDYPRITALVDGVKKHHRIAAYLDSDRRMGFNEDGLFRHYAALDDAELDA